MDISNPQFLAGGTGFLTPDLQVLIWSILVFSGMVFILKKFAWGPLLKALEDREKRIQSRFDEAADKVNAAEQRVVEYNSKIEHVKDEAAEIVAEAKRDAEKLRASIQEEAEKEAQKSLERAKREIHLAKEAATQDLRDKMVDLTSELTARIIEREVGKEDHRKFIETTIDRLSQEDKN